MKLITKKRYIHTILISAMLLVLNIGTAKAEDKDEKMFSVDVTEEKDVKLFSADVTNDYHSTAEVTGRFKLKYNEFLQPYLLTGGNFNWDTLQKPGAQKTTIKDIYRYDVGLNLGAGLSWNVSKGVSLYAEPYLKYNVYEGFLNPSLNKGPGEKKADQNLRLGLHYGF
jgi:opacity protein-like surface antigen